MPRLLPNPLPAPTHFSRFWHSRKTQRWGTQLFHSHSYPGLSQPSKYAVLFIGAGSALGESVMLGHLKRFPPRLVSGWSSGTGGAGLAGAGLFLALESLGLSYSAIFLMSVPLVVLYVGLFFVFLARPTREMEAETRAVRKGSDIDGGVEAEALLGAEGGDVVADVPPMTWARLKHALWLSRYYSLNLGLVYLLEYAISGGFAAYRSLGS